MACPAGSKITGLAATGGQLDVNHSWKVVQRGLLGQITGFSDDVIETTHASHRTLDPHHRDAILLLKESISSSMLSQPPLLLLPHAHVQNAPPREALEILPRNVLSERHLKEFRKTADCVEAEPWKLCAGAKYLRDLCRKNEDSEPRAPLDLHFIFEHSMVPIAERGMVFDPPQPVMPARVAVLPVPLAEHNRRILKRPAATRGDVAARRPRQG